MRLVKLIGLLMIVIIINIVVLSPGFLGIEINSNSALEKAFALSVLIVSGLIVLYASFRYVFRKKQPNILVRVEDAEELELVQMLAQYQRHRMFHREVAIALDQLERMKQKKDALLDLLKQRFQPTELSYGRFLGVIVDVEKLFQRNVQGLINKLRGSELSDLAGVEQRHTVTFSSRVMQQKQQLKQEYIDYVTGYISANEEILIKLDQLLLETTLLGSTGYEDLDEMPCIQEIDVLIKQTKYYKQ